MGEVFRAHDVRLHRDVAIKVLDRKLVRRRGLKRRFLTEARLQARLEHPSIVPIYDLVEKRKDLFVVMRFIEGLSMDGTLRQTGQAFTVGQACHHFTQVLQALGFAHRRGVVHRDLKPANVMIDGEGYASVLDFGVAHVVGTDIVQGQMVGSPAYMPPEQIRGGYVDSRADIYAAGMSLYWSLTMHHPFERAKDLETLLSWQKERVPPPPTDFRPDLPPAINDIIAHALQKDPRDRFRSCEEFAAALSRVGGGAGPSTDVLGPDARWDARAPVEMPLRLWRDDDDIVRRGQTLDISPGGCLLWTDAPPEAGVSFFVELDLEDGDDAILLRSRVAWAGQTDKGGFTTVGLRFTSVQDPDRERIAQAVREALVLGLNPRERDLQETKILPSSEDFFSDATDSSDGSEYTGSLEPSEESTRGEDK